MSSKIYLSAALASSGNIDRDQILYERLAEEIKNLGGIVYLPHKSFSPLDQEYTNKEVYIGDLKDLLTSNLIVALLDTPSLGVGAEIAISLQEGILVCGFSTKPVSRFITGMLESHPMGSYKIIKTYMDIPDILKSANLI